MGQIRNDYRVQCPEHGDQPAAFVCRHLAKCLAHGDPVGFLTSEDDLLNPRPDAWCDACEARRIQAGGEWTGDAEAFAGVTMVCGTCYDQIRWFNVQH